MKQALHFKGIGIDFRVFGVLTPRLKSWLVVISCLMMLVMLVSFNLFVGDQGLHTNLSLRKLAPSMSNLLGTDWLGRDMVTRILKGLWISFKIGLIAAFLSAVISVILGMAAAVLGKHADIIITGAIDLFMSMPHLVLLILISFAVGGGAEGVIFAVAVTHWPRLCRIIRAEILQLKSSEFIRLSYKFGKPSSWIMVHHMAPHLFSQFLVGLILMFPHAILHSAGLTFLGFGLSPHTPSIGILLSESMRHLSTGYWWLAIFPGIALIMLVKLFEIMGLHLKKMLNPQTRQE